MDVIWRILMHNRSLLISQIGGIRNISGLFPEMVVLKVVVLSFQVLSLKIKLGESTMVGDRTNLPMIFMKKC